MLTSNNPTLVFFCWFRCRKVAGHYLASEFGMPRRIYRQIAYRFVYKPPSVVFFLGLMKMEKSPVGQLQSPTPFAFEPPGFGIFQHEGNYKRKEDNYTLKFSSWEGREPKGWM